MGIFPRDIFIVMAENSPMEITRENLLHLIRSELDKRDLSIASLEKQSGVPKDTVRDFLRGKTQILRADKMQKVMQILQPESKIFISGYVGEESEIFLSDSDNKEEVECPPGFEPGDLSAVRIEGDSMVPVFHNGWVIYYSRSASAKLQSGSGLQVPYNKTSGGDKFAEFVGKPCVIKLTDGRLMLRTLKTGSKAELYNLISYNSPDIKDAKIEWVARIIFIKT